ncbi:hypothetical protein NLI92_002890 [Priestia megaterium]|uniref:hypothetical protein n=1 Tax=Priestia megaterium TaxID=1404 RepID=UPI0021ABE32E|nr:hypothetical protein [Priestia megaterium]MCR8927499.1 hypothetical protein [Priestia megaterium]
MLCRGTLTRVEIVKEYDIAPIAHVKLLAGQEKKSCTNDKLEHRYYCFSYKHKKDKNKSGTFICGKHAANHFLKLLNHKEIPLFNPLSSERVSHGGGSGRGDETRDTREWNPIAKELSNAINFLIISWNTPPKDVLSDIKKRLETAPMQKPRLNDVKAVNTIISHDKKKRKLSDMIEELRKDNPSLKEYSFGRLNQILANEDKPSHFS